LRLQIAVSEADTRLIEDPMGELWPVSPAVDSILIKFTGAGLALPALIMLLIVFLDTTVRGRKDIEDTLSMPFIGEVPGFDKGDDNRPLLDKLRGIDNRVKSNKIVITNDSKNALAEGDAVAIEAVNRACHYLAIASGNLVNTFSPDVVVYGGGVIEAVGDIFLEKILAEVDRYCMPSIRSTVEFKKAALGDDSILYGALSMIKK
jgi:hypothetical protein